MSDDYPDLSDFWAEPGQVEIRTGNGSVVATGPGTMRIERLETLAAGLPVPLDSLAGEGGHQVVQETLEQLRKELARTMAQAGRVPHGEIQVSKHDYPVLNVRYYQAEVVTRECDEGEWPAIHAAFRSDQAALRGDADDWDEG